MKYFSYKIFSLVLLTLLFATGCLNNTNNQVAEPSNNATVLAAYISASTDSPNASSAVFTIDNNENKIYNVDSLPYGTKIDSLYIGFRFASSLGFIINDSVSESVNPYYSNGTTSKHVNFNDSVKIRNLATDGESTKEYTIELRVHKVETYLHVWNKLNANVTATPSENQKAILFKDKFFYYFGHSSSNTLYTSTDATSWAQTSSDGLPLNTELRNMVILADNVYLLHNGNEIYISADGANWTQNAVTVDADYSLKALLFPFKNKLWAVAQHTANNSVKIASSSDGLTWTFPGERTFYDNFPVRDFAATSFKPALEGSKVVVIGGFTPSGKRLNTIWAAEDVLVDTLNWINLQNAKSNLAANSRAAVGYYGSKLLLLGGTTNTLLTDTLQLRQSINQGLNWISPDTTVNRIPEGYIARSNVSLINDSKDNSLYVIGGRSATASLSDVWKIKVNFYSFEDYLKNPYKY